MSSSGLWAYLPLIGILFYLALAALALLLNGVIRAAVTRGMRDHQQWLERTGRASGPGAGPASYTPDAPHRV